MNVSDNFVCYAHDAELAGEISDRCEKLRFELATRWLGECGASSWKNCRCLIVVHATADSYASAVGRGAEHSTGLSLTRTDRGKIILRRIDLRSDRGDPLVAALPHELTHVVLADRFVDRRLPRWADEGIAILADSDDKRHGHRLNAITAATGAGAVFQAGELLRLADYPPASRQRVFYGQSVMLVELLVARGDEKTLIDFVERSLTEGDDEALRSIYGIDGVAELNQLLRAEVAERATTRAIAKPASATGTIDRHG